MLKRNLKTAMCLLKFPASLIFHDEMMTSSESQNTLRGKKKGEEGENGPPSNSNRRRISCSLLLIKCDRLLRGANQKHPWLLTNRDLGLYSKQ